MGHIKEPKGVDLLVGPSVITEQDKKVISEIIANYKLTGKKIPVKARQVRLSNRKKIKSSNGKKEV